MIDFTPQQLKVMKVLGDCPTYRDGQGTYNGYAMSHLADLVSGTWHAKTTPYEGTVADLINGGWVEWNANIIGTPELRITKVGRLDLMETGKLPKQYWFVSVGGALCEPAVFCAEGIFTIGCPDNHDPDDIAFVKWMKPVPDTPADAIKRQRAYERKEALERASRSHGYRVFV